MSTRRRTDDRSVRALRGATAVDRDDPTAISVATEELLRELLTANSVRPEDLISMIFTATPDLTSAFPAIAARNLGLGDVPLLCSVEIGVPGSVERCVRVLIHLATDLSPGELKHVYLGPARALREDLDV